MTYFLNKLRNVLNLEPSSCSWLSAGMLDGVAGLGVPGLVFGVEVAGVAKGVLEVEVMIWALGGKFLRFGQGACLAGMP